MPFRRGNKDSKLPLKWQNNILSLLQVIHSLGSYFIISVQSRIGVNHSYIWDNDSPVLPLYSHYQGDPAD